MSQKRLQPSSVDDDDQPHKRRKIGSSFAAIFKNAPSSTEKKHAWLTELRDLVVEMDETGRKQARTTAGNEVWAQMVHLKVPPKFDGEPRSLLGQTVRGVRITEWDIMPSARPIACEMCIGLKRTCLDTMTAKPHAKCRECILKQKPCVAGKPDKVKPPVPEKLKPHFEDPTRDTNKQGWLLELQRLILQMSPDEQRSVKEQLPDSQWAELVHLELPLNSEGKVRALAGIVSKISDWDLLPKLAPKPCRQCMTRIVACEYANTNVPQAKCRRCALSVNQECTPMSKDPPPQPSAVQEQTDSLLYIDFVNIHNDKAKKDEDKKTWLKELRDMVLQMTEHKQNEVRTKLGDGRWTQFVGLNLPERMKDVGNRTTVQVADWDLVPCQAGVPCEACKVANVTCEYTSLCDAEGLCRECSFTGAECIRKHPRSDLFMTPDVVAKKFTDLCSAPPEEPAARRTWLQQLQHIAVQLASEKQKELRSEIGDDLWSELVWNSCELEGRQLEGTTVNGVSITSWDLSYASPSAPCERCRSEGRHCVFVNGKDSECRECTLDGEQCAWPMQKDESSSQASTQYDKLSRPTPRQSFDQDTDKGFAEFCTILGNEGKKKAGKRHWLTQLREIALKMDSERQENARKRAGDELWAELVYLPIDSKKLVDQKTADFCKIADWDLVPEEYAVSCERCIAAQCPCERTQRGTVGACRRCRVKRRGCSNKAVGVEDTAVAPLPARTPSVRRIQPPPPAPSTTHGELLSSRTSTVQVAKEDDPVADASMNVGASVSNREAEFILSSISKSELRLLDRLERELERKDRELERKEEELHAMRVQRMEREKGMMAERQVLVKELERVRAERDSGRTNCSGSQSS